MRIGRQGAGKNYGISPKGTKQDGFQFIRYFIYSTKVHWMLTICQPLRTQQSATDTEPALVVLFIKALLGIHGRKCYLSLCREQFGMWESFEVLWEWELSCICRRYGIQEMQRQVLTSRQCMGSWRLPLISSNCRCCYLKSSLPDTAFCLLVKCYNRANSTHWCCRA